MLARLFQCAFTFFVAACLCRAELNLHGRVEDENGAPVAGAVVSIRASGQQAQPGPGIQAETGLTGAFDITLPGAGPYLVSVSKQDFFPLSDKKIELQQSPNTLVLTLNHVRNTSQSVNVSASPAAIDVDQTDSERELSGRQVFEVPYSSDHDLRNAFSLMPGVVQGPTGDLHFDGGAENQTLYMLDGFNVSDPLTGTFNTHLSVDAVESIDFRDGRYAPEFGKGSSGALSIRTEAGDDTWRYSGTNFIPGLDTSGGLHLGAYTPRLNLSGPIIKGRLWFSDSVDADYNQLYVPNLPGGQNMRTSFGASDLLHLQANLTPANILVADVLANFTTTPNADLGALTPLPTTYDQRNREWFFSAKDQIYVTRGTLLELGVADLRTFARQIPHGDALYQYTPDGVAGNYYVNSTQHSERKQFLANVFFRSLHWAGTHQIKAGTDLDRLDYSQDILRTGFENVSVTGAVLRQVTFGGSGILSRPSLEASSYVQDTWKLRSNLVLQGGVRQDWDELIRDTVLSPRVSASYAPFASGKTKIAAGYAVVYDATPPQLFSRPQDQYSLTTVYNPDGTIQSGPAETVFVSGGHLSAPRYDNWSAGLEQMLPANVLLSVNLLRRRTDDGLTYVNILNPNGPLPSGLAPVYQATQFASVYQLQNSGTFLYHSAELRLHQRFGKGFEWMASYTRSLATSNSVVDVNIDQPTVVSLDTGRLPWDAPNRFLTWGYLPSPFQNWAIAYLFETRTGFPFSVVDQVGRIVGAPDSYRYPDYLNLNLHLEWTTHLFGYRFALRGGLNNITNHNNYTLVNDTLGSPNFLAFYGSTGRHFVVRIRWLGRVGT